MDVILGVTVPATQSRSTIGQGHSISARRTSVARAERRGYTQDCSEVKDFADGFLVRSRSAAGSRLTASDYQLGGLGESTTGFVAFCSSCPVLATVRTTSRSSRFCFFASRSRASSSGVKSGMVCAPTTINASPEFEEW